MSVPLGILFCLIGRGKIVVFFSLAERGNGEEGGKIRKEEIRAQGSLLWSHTINHKALHALTQQLKEPREVKSYCSLIPDLK